MSELFMGMFCGGSQSCCNLFNGSQLDTFMVKQYGAVSGATLCRVLIRFYICAKTKGNTLVDKECTRFKLRVHY